jgi:hypothetical protein
MEEWMSRSVSSLTLLAVALALSEASVHADGPGVISGEVVNGTSGGVVAGGGQVALGVYRGDNLEREIPTQADGTGRFQFADLEVDGDLTYQLGTAHGDMLYRSDPVKLTETQAEQQVSLTVYEQTPTDPGLRASQVFVSVNVARDNPQELVINEFLRLRNPADRTFAPQPGGPGGPMDLVRFGLPPGASKFQPGFGLDPKQVIEVDRGFGSLAPVPPGETVFRFAYRVPFKGRGDLLEKSLPYGAEVLRVMTEEGGPRMANPALTFEQTVDTKGAKVLVWAARGVAPGTRLNLELSDMPGASIWARLRDGFTSLSVLAVLPWVLSALVGLLPVLGVFWTLRGRARPQRASSSKPVPGSLVDAVAETLVDLDDAFSGGRVSELE